MTIKDIYTNLIKKEIIKDLLFDEEIPSVAKVSEQMTAHMAEHDLSKPLHTFAQAEVAFGEESSATKYNTTMQNIYKDLSVAYTALIDISNSSSKLFDRWRAKATILEDRLVGMVDRITSLLLLQEDTAGYLNFVQVNFRDISDIDPTNTTAKIDTAKGVAVLSTQNALSTRVYPLDNVTEKDIEFNLLTQNGVMAKIASPGSRLKYAFDGTSNFFQERVYTKNNISVSAELKVCFGDTALPISRVDVDLHTSSRSDTVQVLPMYSADGKTWYRVPSTDYVLNIIDKGTFRFTTLSARYFKFILTKTGPDFTDKVNGNVYEFGVDDISFFSESYSTDSDGQQVVTNLLSIEDPTTKTNRKFSKVSLDVCESVETDATDIQYSVAVTNDSTQSVSSATWMDIDPSKRENPKNTAVIDFGEIGLYEKTRIKVSYDPLNTTSQFVDPSQTFSLLTSMSGLSGTITYATASAQRYVTHDPAFKILDLEVSPNVGITKGTVKLWRNVCLRGNNTLIRDNPMGWGLEEDYYVTTVLVKNSTGAKMDFGPNPIIIDEVSISGKYTVPMGIHKVKVHKNNFAYVSTSGITTLTLLKLADPLYPYNHRYIVEGFNYPSTWSTNFEKPYGGFDIVAEYLMTQVGIVEVVSLTEDGNYGQFAMDLDVEDILRAPSGISTTSNTIFLVKVDPSKSDFLNEEFTLQFRPVNTEYEYIRVRAILKSTSEEKTPILSSFRVKVM